MKQIKLSLGSDPELMVLDRELDRMASALRVFPGKNKDNPIDLGDGIVMYPDNALLEFRHPPVSGNDGPEPLVSMLGECMGRMAEKLGPRYKLTPRAAHIFHPDELGVSKVVNDEETNPAWEAGCMPNHNAYTNKLRSQIEMAEDFKRLGTMRTGSLHIHVGNQDWETEDGIPLLTSETRIAAVKLLDIYLGLASVLLEKDATSIERRKLYGKAGEYRPTGYGIEYRVLGPSPLSSPDRISLIQELATFAVRRLETDAWKDILTTLNEHHVQEAVNTGNVSLAWVLVNKAEMPLKFIQQIMSNP